MMGLDLTIVLAIAGGAVVVVAGAYFYGRAAGGSAERARQAAANAKARDSAREVEDDVASRSADENRERLAKWAK